MPFKYKIFLGKGADCPLHPSPKSLTIFFPQYSLCELLIFDQKGNEIVYLRPIKYKIFL